MPSFTNDGYIDLDTLADDMWDKGATLGAKDKHQLKQFIACVLHETLAMASSIRWEPDRGLAFYQGCLGIVDCAQMGELI
jgi:hypothetical protein